MSSTQLQCVLVDVDGVGVLIRGPSGSGKSLAALHLMDRGHRLVADDMVLLRLGPNGIPIGAALEPDVRIEIRGLGIFPARSLFENGTALECAVHLVVDLDEYDPERDSGRIEPETGAETILGCKLPRVRVPVAQGMDHALLIEFLARRLKESGAI